MISTASGSIRLFRLAGINVLLHWSWLLVAWWQISARRGAYPSIWWNVAEYLGLFAIVLMHEFGHALASRQVGGESKEILLWPFGGIAFVRVPPRAGAELWAIAAGPLVNVALFPILWALHVAAADAGWTREIAGLNTFLRQIRAINLALLLFNLLPLYPLDGGQIVRSLLWFPLGRARSLFVATIFTFIALPVAVWYAWTQTRFDKIWSLLLGFLVLQQCFVGWKYAKALRALERAPRHVGYRCPTCRQAPPGGPLWACEHCGNRMDPFSTHAVCPHCARPQTNTGCPHCGAAHPLAAWENRG